MPETCMVQWRVAKFLVTSVSSLFNHGSSRFSKKFSRLLSKPNKLSLISASSAPTCTTTVPTCPPWLLCITATTGCHSSSNSSSRVPSLAATSTTTAAATTTTEATPTTRHCHRHPVGARQLQPAMPPTSASWQPTPSWTMSCAGQCTSEHMTQWRFSSPKRLLGPRLSKADSTATLMGSRHCLTPMFKPPSAGTTCASMVWIFWHFKLSVELDQLTS